MCVDWMRENFPVIYRCCVQANAIVETRPSDICASGERVFGTMHDTWYARKRDQWIHIRFSRTLPKVFRRDGSTRGFTISMCLCSGGTSCSTACISCTCVNELGMRTERMTVDVFFSGCMAISARRHGMDFFFSAMAWQRYVRLRLRFTTIHTLQFSDEKHAVRVSSCLYVCVLMCVSSHACVWVGYCKLYVLHLCGSRK